TVCPARSDRLTAPGTHGTVRPEHHRLTAQQAVVPFDTQPAVTTTPPARITGKMLQRLVPNAGGTVA
ncbi:hypothetical protein JW613_13025, partial [Streptomyces smyrnaeus]